MSKIKTAAAELVAWLDCCGISSDFVEKVRTALAEQPEMWEALAAYQPQADAKGHGETWAAMCKEKTYSAAAEAAYADGAAAAAEAAYAAAAAVADAAAYSKSATEWAQRATDRINKLKENP